jgi:hypothetical protein
VKLDTSTAARVQFPLLGEWLAVDTPAERVPRHDSNYFGQRYAYGFVRSGGPAKRWCSESAWRRAVGRVPASAFFAWDAPVLAAFDGRIARMGDDWPDHLEVNAVIDTVRTLFARPPVGDDFRPLTGNFVLLEGAPGVALYAHLRRGSVKVREGDRVHSGDELGRVGNSGDSATPHLHFHLMSHADPLTAEGRLCAFDGIDEFIDGAWRALASGVPDPMTPVRRRSVSP